MKKLHVHFDYKREAVLPDCVYMYREIEWLSSHVSFLVINVHVVCCCVTSLTADYFSFRLYQQTYQKSIPPQDSTLMDFWAQHD